MLESYALLLVPEAVGRACRPGSPRAFADGREVRHLVWTVLDAVGELDLSAFYAAYRSDGHGRPAYEPSMMVALLLCAYARGNRSSRG